MKAVDERKKEQERRDERKIQKEREAEGEQFADKEAYVTTAYKQKLLERKEEEEQEKREAVMEGKTDYLQLRGMGQKREGDSWRETKRQRRFFLSLCVPSMCSPAYS